MSLIQRKWGVGFLLLSLVTCNARFLSCWHQVETNSFAGIETGVIRVYDDDSSDFVESSIQIFSVADPEFYMFDNLVRSVLSPVAWIFYQLEAAQDWNRFMIYSLLTSADDSIIVTVNEQTATSMDMLSSVALGRFYAAMQDMEDYKKAAMVANQEEFLSSAFPLATEASLKENASILSIRSETDENDEDDSYVVFYGTYYDEEEGFQESFYADDYDDILDLQEFSGIDGYSGYEDLYFLDNYEQVESLLLLDNLLPNREQADTLRSSAIEEPIEELFQMQPQTMNPLLNIWSLLSDPAVPPHTLPGRPMKEPESALSFGENEIDWHLRLEDGGLNWSLITLLVLVLGFLGMLSAFFVSLMQLRRVLSPDNCDHDSSDSISRPLLAFPVKCARVKDVCPQYVVIAAKHVPVASNQREQDI